MEIKSSKKNARCGNEELAFLTVKELQRAGIAAAALAPGIRNSALIAAITELEPFPYTFWNDERSAAFFALGKARRLGRPAAVIVTSGTAAGEVLPAVMEAYYSGVPLLIVTADRPRRYRGSGAPQTVEQVGLYGCYTPTVFDIAEGEFFSLELWDQRAPLHLNICFEEGYSYGFDHFADVALNRYRPATLKFNQNQVERVVEFLSAASFPIAVIGGLDASNREGVVAFLLAQQIPVYAEAISGIAGDSRLAGLRIAFGEHLLDRYPIDAVLRIGGVPTVRFWRDLESKCGEVKVLSIAETPFAGLSWGESLQAGIGELLDAVPSAIKMPTPTSLIEKERKHQSLLLQILAEEPQSEPSLVYELSQRIPRDAEIYLGNSMPIREWDLVAGDGSPQSVWASRGANGIDGQLSTFYGLAAEGKENWALLGDLTTLYDMTAPWVITQLGAAVTRLVVMNNGGGRIFDRLTHCHHLQNQHHHHFSSVAEMWKMEYFCWKSVPSAIPPMQKHALIEILPDHEATRRVWKKIVCLCSNDPL